MTTKYEVVNTIANIPYFIYKQAIWPLQYSESQRREIA